MGVAHLGPEEMAYFTDPSQRDPRAVRVEEQLRGYAERVGGLTLEYWQLALGHVWGRPHMMTMDEAAKRLDRPISELRRIDEQTNEALGWANHDQQPAPDQKA
ncbi:MAG: hypothetical protein ACT4O0_12160 [Pseudonocardia sp.]|jgi:hypothetical protein